MKSISPKTIFWVFFVVFAIQSGILFGLALTDFQIGSQSPTPDQAADNPDGANSSTSSAPVQPIPDSVIDREIEENRYSIRFQRTSKNSELFDRYLHDPVLVRGGENKLYLIAAEAKKGNQVLYMTNISTPTDWKLIDDYYFGPEGAIDDIVYAQNRYIAYANDGIYTTTDLTQDNWTRQRDIPSRTNDLGAHFDGERVHIYYEADRQNASGPSGKEIGHATSPDGIRNWTHYPTVFRAPGKYGVGDFEIVNQGDAILLFGDYSQTHPKYEIRMWANDNYYTKFSQLENPAIEPRSGNTTYTDDFGVQDGSVVKLPNGSYLMIANGHESASSDVHLHYYISNSEPSRNTPE